jgi:hypothetical protein
MGLLKPHGRGRGLFWRDELTQACGTESAGVPPACGPAVRGPIIVIHSLPHAVAALSAAAEAGRPVTLLSALNAGLYAGPGWFREVIAAARQVVPVALSSALLDCGDDAGAAQGAIRAGVEGIVFTGPADVAARLDDIGRQRGVQVVTARPKATLDLADIFFASAEFLRGRCADVLASPAGFC